MSRALRAADRWFRLAGVATLLALAATALSLATGRGEWRVPFVLAHLAALMALAPLGAVLVARSLAEGYRVRRSVTGALREAVARHRGVVGLLLAVAATVTVSLANQDGARALRATANLVTVGAVLVLVAMYLRSSRS